MDRLQAARAAVRELARRPRRGQEQRQDQREARQWQTALAGLSLTYGWARQTFLRAYDRGDDAAFRAWWTAVKYHLLHIRLLAERWPEQLSGRLEVLQRLGELLAQDQSLSTFERTAAPEGRSASSELRSLVVQRHQGLRALARPLGRRLFSDPPAVFRRRLQTCWQSSGASSHAGTHDRARAAA
jgi:hypothetical protein